MKGEAPEGKELVDSTIIIGGVDSPKPSLHKMEVSSDICVENITGIKVVVDKGKEAYRNASWGSIGILMGANVRAMGI